MSSATRPSPAGWWLKVGSAVVLAAFVASASAPPALALGQVSYVSSDRGPGRFALSADRKSAPLHASADEYPGVLRALRDLQEDIARVTQVRPALVTDRVSEAREIVIAGTLGKSSLIDRLVRAGKLDVKGLEGRWEMFLTQVVDRALPGVDRALVIAGSDKRGTIYGIYDLSEQIGVSPWYCGPTSRSGTTAACMCYPGATRRASLPSSTGASSSTTRRRHSPDGSGRSSAASIARSTRRCSSWCCGSRAIISGRPCGGGP